MSLRGAMVTILLPAYNEEAVIGSTISKVNDLCARRPERQWEILVVDDGSADETSVEANAVASEVSTPVRVLRHRANRGLGGALRTGLLASRGDIVLTADCDLSYSVDTLERLLDAYENTGVDIVIASPYMPGGATRNVPKALEVRSRAANAWLRLTSLDDIYTLTGMVRAYDGDFIRSLSLKAVDVDINAEILYKAQLLRANIVEIPAVLDWSHLQGRAGRSKLLAKRARVNTYKQVINGYLWRPFLFPLVGSLIFGLIALGALISGALTLESLGEASLLLCVLLAFQTLNTLQAKRYFEELFHALTQVRRVSPTPPVQAESVSPSSMDSQEHHRAERVPCRVERAELLEKEIPDSGLESVATGAAGRESQRLDG